MFEKFIVSNNNLMLFVLPKKRQVQNLVIAFLLLLTFGACQRDNAEKALRKPNILFCIADDASFPHMSAYGCSWVNTPGFDRVAKEGILFTNAYTPNAKCAPSRACILTGRNSWQLEEAANHSPNFPAKFRTFAEALSAHGYFVGYTAKGWAPGDPGEVNGKKRLLTGQPFNEFSTIPPAEHISNNDYAANFRSFLKNRPQDQPFCFWYGSLEPHRAYEFSAGIKKGGKELTSIEEVPDFWPDNDTVRADLLDYAFELEYFDQHLVKMMEILEEAGELDHTLIVVTADNGMPFPRVKGQAYELSNHLPLAIMWKNGIQHAGRTVDDFVSFIDFAPTFLEVAGLNSEEAGMQPIQGQSLSDILFSEKSGTVNPERDYVLIGKERHDVGRPQDWGYPIRGILTKDFLYLHNFEPTRWPAGNPETGYLNVDGSPTKTVAIEARHQQEEQYWQWSFGKRPSEELYKISQDEDCIHNLALDPEYVEIIASLKEQLFNELQQQGDPRMFGKGNVFDEYPYSGEVQGFYERYMSGEDVKANWVNASDFEKEPLE